MGGDLQLGHGIGGRDAPVTAHRKDGAGAHEITEGVLELRAIRDEVRHGVLRGTDRSRPYGEHWLDGT